MTTVIEGNHGIYLGAQAWIVEEARELAWAERSVQTNPAHVWLLGRFVEANRANNNRQLFSLDGLRMKQPTIAHAPMNMNHSPKRIVGAYVDTELLYPMGQTAALGEGDDGGATAPTRDGQTCANCGAEYDPGEPDDPQGEGDLPGILCPDCAKGLTEEQTAADTNLANPYIEALGVMWKHYFPDEYQLIKTAHEQGHLFFSMECVPSRIACSGTGGCGQEYAYVGRQSPTYCAHINETSSDKLLIDPHFTGGAILVPPVRPGWSNADIHSLVARHAEAAEAVYDQVSTDMPHLGAGDWENIMLLLLAQAD